MGVSFPPGCYVQDIWREELTPARCSITEKKTCIKIIMAMEGVDFTWVTQTQRFKELLVKKALDRKGILYS